MMRRTALLAVLLAVLPITAGSAQTSSTLPRSSKTNVEIIFDASRSMYGRLPSGESRIIAAKDVLTSFITSLPDNPDLNVALRIYGSVSAASEPTACTDTKLVLPLKSLDRPALLDAVIRTTPKGATPIALSLEQAAADFPRDGSRKLVILVTDGQESCKGDLKAAFAKFKADGIEIDLRIIGIDLDKTAIAAFQGIGKIENARSLGELVAALGRAAEGVVEPETDKIPVNVRLTAGQKGRAGTAKVTFVSALDPTKRTELTEKGNDFVGAVVAGTYSAVIETTESGVQTFSGLAVGPGATNTFTFDVTKTASVRLEISPSQPTGGATVSVKFSGAPAGARNWITVVRKTDPDRGFLDYEYVSTAAGSVELTVPDDEVEYEVRYHLAAADGSTRVVGRSTAFTPKRIAASVTAPDTATAGSIIDVRWTGPNNADDYVTVVKAGAPVGTFGGYVYTKTANPVKLTLPLQPGAYEIRYVSGTTSPNPTRASRPIKISAASYAIDAPAVVSWGATIDIRWTGPDNRGEYITVVKPDAAVGTFTVYAYTRDGNPLKLEMPAEPGTYELRYSSDAASPNPVLARRTITVEGGKFSVQAPSTAVAGSTVSVRFTGSASSREYVTVVKKGAPVGTFGSYVYTRTGNPAQLRMPDEPGQYEIRYLTGATSPNPTLASTPITVTAPITSTTKR